MYRIFAAILLLCAVLTDSGPSYAYTPPAAILAPGIAAAPNLAYGTHPRQTLDLFYSETRVLPLVVFIHGGAWESGDKAEDLAYGLTYYGFAVASINYRLSRDAIFPAQLEDCKLAVRWLRFNAGRYHLDPTRVAVYGASAGAHLASLMGTTGGVAAFDVGDYLEESSRVQAVVDFFGPSDLALYGPSKPDDALTRLFGGLTASLPEQVAAANPITYIAPGDPPFFIAHGDSDTIVPLIHSQILVAALQKAGVPVELHVVEGGGHGFEGRKLQKALEAAGSFLGTHLHEPG